MLFQSTVLLFFPAVLGLISKWTPDRCWMNKDPNDADIAGVCPLFHTDLKVPVYCSINLTPDNMDNEKCRRCVWRENTESLCQPTKHWQRRMCCCKRPMCNKEIFEDAMPGWHMTKGKKEEYESKPENAGTIICIHARFDKGKWDKGKWDKGVEDKTTEKYNYIPVTTNTMGGAKARCYFNMTTKGGKLDTLGMGTADKETSKKCDEVAAEHDHDRCKQEYDNTTKIGHVFCCCEEKWCNQKLYMQKGFDTLMEVRQVAERYYKKQIEDAAKKVPSSIWYNRESYHEVKPTVDAVLIIGTAIYIVIILAACRLYVPVDMDKREAPAGASKERAAE